MSTGRMSSRSWLFPPYRQHFPAYLVKVRLFVAGVGGLGKEVLVVIITFLRMQCSARRGKHVLLLERIEGVGEG